LTPKYQIRLPSFKTRLTSSPPEDESHGNGKQATTKLVYAVIGYLKECIDGSEAVAQLAVIELEI
jgi:hypothetical protein